MAIIISTSFGKDLLPGVQKFTGLAYEQWAPLYDKIFEVVKTKERFAEDIMSLGLGLASYRDETEPYKYDAGNQLWTKRYTQAIMQHGFQVSREAVDDGHALKIAKEFTDEAVRGIQQAREVVCHNVLNNAFTSGYNGGDGVVLCSTAHVTGAGGNYKNRPSTDLDVSEASLEQMSIDVDSLINERGLKMTAKIKSLVIPIGLRFEVHRILKSANQVHTADRTTNALKDMDIVPDIITSPFLTAAQTYFAITDVPNGLKYIERNALEVSDENSFDNDVAKFKFRIRFTQGWTNPRGVYGVVGP